MWLVHDALPGSAPFQSDRYTDRADFGKESIFIIIGTAAVGSVNIKRRAPLMIATITAALCICDNFPRLSASLSIRGILLCRGTQRLTDFDLQSLLLAFLGKLRGPRLESRMA